MPEAQNEDNSALDLISQLVIADDDPPDFARFKGVQLLPQTWIGEQLFSGARELLDHSRRSIASNWPKVIVQTHKILCCLAGPLNSHRTGEGSGLSAVRLSAHARML